MKRILSTKTLSSAQRELLLRPGLSLSCYDAIATVPLDFIAPPRIENALFTSQNGVRRLLDKLGSLHTIERIYCVGKKTADLCVKNGGNLSFFAENSEELATFLQKQTNIESIYYFCAQDRLDHLPNRLKSTKIDLIEVKTYKTEHNLRHFDSAFDALLFFSPSAVRSYQRANSLKGDPMVFCIGPTTAAQAKKFFEKVVISKSATTESLIAKVVKTLKDD